MEKWTERAELLSELHHLKNHLIGQLAEVDMAIRREENAFDVKKLKTVTQQTKELLNKAQQPRPLWSMAEYQRQALSQDDAKSMQNQPPYENLIQ